jgi:pimeloyl-ACP methyl ester carboxylesterase
MPMIQADDGVRLYAESTARPSLYGLASELAGIRVPVLIMTGDEDEGCLESALMLKRAIPGSGLSVLPQTGHTANLEDPAAFNRAVDRSWRRSTAARGGSAIPAPCPPPPSA